MAQATTKLTSGELRLIDANLGRLREGIRVVEDICRFILGDSKLTKILKTLRHSVKSSLLLEAMQNRDIINDCSKTTTESESSRADMQAILIANFKRAEESARVLEELLKLYDTHEAEEFKQIRYSLYNLEKIVLDKVAEQND